MLDNIKKHIDGDIQKSKLEEFLKNGSILVKKRLSLIKLILEGFNPEEEYVRLKRINSDINENINKLENNKDDIILFYKDYYREIINRIIEVIKNNQNEKIKEFKEGRIRELILEAGCLMPVVETINKVKNFLLFNAIYELNSGKDEYENFNNAYKILQQIKEYFY